MKECAQIQITGVVQGVGFRPFVYNLALRLGLNGWVRNTSAGVTLEVEGEKSTLDAFIRALTNEPPALAQIDTVAIKYANPNGFNTFEIIHSEAIHGAFQPISPDICICADCLHELFDPEDRRYLYPFINCTNCGPRFTIIQDIPYDRPLTTMAQFQMCPECAQEYYDPLNRRFHAQPVACPKCGPIVWLEDKNSKIEPIADQSYDESIIKTQTLLREGRIIAVKGLGGFHLACDATNDEVVRELRIRKFRVDKPFALMMADMNVVQKHCFVNPDEARLLESKERPIVILPRKPDSNISKDVAPNQLTLGVMLPYTPLHFLLFSKLGFTRKQNGSGLASTFIPEALVMTSGNLAEEPIAIDNEEARIRLAPLSDAFLMHNREINTRCDDSVVRIFQGKVNNPLIGKQDTVVFPIRRSRGYAPFPVNLSKDVPPVLAVGGELKNTFCLTQKNYAFMSHHIGDIENYETLKSFEDGINHFEKLFRVKPILIAHDLHPNYLSTKYALERSKSEKIPSLGVQHHHAHIAACMTENNLDQNSEVFGIAFDGTGFGDDGAIWGGEFFLASYRSYQRFAHLEYMPLPGGDAATRKPARIALAYLWQIGKEWEIAADSYFALNHEERTVLRSQLVKNINTPITSSMGRLFDAVSALVGVRQIVNYEAQAAIELESLVDENEKKTYPFEIDASNLDSPQLIRLNLLIESIIDDITHKIPLPIISARFHNTISQIVLEVVMAMRNMYGDKPIVLSGGVWQNMTLLNKTLNLLRTEIQQVYIHKQVPTNDGGIALGQAMVSIFNANL
jgi:hydrogenase maturation protein HypF